jgi:hypothetical protein
MSRPLIQSRIRDLEEIFAASKDKRDVLEQLEYELRYRQVPRALALLELVQRAKSTTGAGRAVESPSAAHFLAAPMEQPRLDASEAYGPLVTAAQLSLLSLPTQAETDRIPIRALVQSVIASDHPIWPSGHVQPPPDSPSAMSSEDAYRHLKVAPGANWEAVEHARRVIVQKSSPLAIGASAAQRGPAIATARLANMAYAVLAANRSASCRT